MKGIGSVKGLFELHQGHTQGHAFGQQQREVAEPAQVPQAQGEQRCHRPQEQPAEIPPVQERLYQRVQEPRLLRCPTEPECHGEPF